MMHIALLEVGSYCMKTVSLFLPACHLLPPLLVIFIFCGLLTCNISYITPLQGQGHEP